MSDKSGIEWTDATWPVVVGCTKKSSGCANCCAIRDAVRLAGNPNQKIHTIYRGLVESQANEKLNWTGLVRCVPERLEIPLRWRKPRRIFVPYMGDIFHPSVPFDFIDKIFAVMALCPQHTFQVLTKDADRMFEYFESRDNDYLSEEHTLDFSHLMFDKHGQLLAPLKKAGWFIDSCKDEDGIKDSSFEYHGLLPLPNVWLGVSVENQEMADKRIPYLLQTPAAVRFISAEPLLAPVDLSRWMMPFEISRDDEGGDLGSASGGSNIDWCIVGGESGSGARPMHPQWARDLRNQCVGAGVSIFFKQWGEFCHWDQFCSYDADASKWSEPEWFSDKTPGLWIDESGKPSDTDNEDAIWLYRVGKKHAGRLLDGVEWNQMPEVER